MHVIRARNVAQALPAGLAYLDKNGRWEDSRAGRVIVAPGPVTTVYERPRERVLFSALRDANPFFHLAESLWMLAGRNDSAFLNHFVRDFGDRFAEADGKVHDAYGRRWRIAFGLDQIHAVVQQMSESPHSRQAVLQMWGAEVNGENDLLGNHRARPCNTHAYLRIRDQTDLESNIGMPKVQKTPAPVLDLTVCCRSNDIVWGAYGANAVHFSVLQEYLAARLDVGVGTYYQVSNNYHCYEEQWGRLMPGDGVTWIHLNDDRYGGAAHTPVAPQPLVHDADSFDQEVNAILKFYESGDYRLTLGSFYNGFLSGTVWPMLQAHRAWKEKSPQHVTYWLAKVEAEDWRVTAEEWIKRRMKAS